MNTRYYIKLMENVELIKAQAIPGECVLDLGCGKGGTDAIEFERRGYDVTAVDKSSEYPKTKVMDIRDFDIEKGKFKIVICHNVLPFISDKKEVELLVSRIVDGLKKDGIAFITFYGKNSVYKDRKDMSFYEYDEILSVLEKLPIDLLSKTIYEGLTKAFSGKVVYEHSFRFLVRKK